MRKKRIHHLSAVVALLLSVLLLASCASAEPSSTAASKGATSTASSGEQSTASGDATGEVDTSPITITIGINSTSATAGIWNTSVGEEITRQTGVTLDVILMTQDKMKVLAAGGDLPEICQLPSASASDVKSMITSGQLLPLDDLLAQHGQNILNNEPMALKYAQNVVAPDGKTYFIPTSVSKADPENPRADGWIGFFTRYDLYKEIGAPEVYGEDEYLDMLKQLQDYAREQNPDKKIYALSAWTDWDIFPFNITYPFCFGYLNLHNNMLGDMETGEVQSTFLAEDGIFWDSLYFYNKAHRMGLFDPDGFTQQWQQYVDKVKDGLLLTSSLVNPLDPEVCGEDAVLGLIPGAFPVVAGIYRTTNETGTHEADARCITTNCKDPERAMQLLNFFESPEGARLLMNGVKGVDWDVVDGVPQIIGERLAAISSAGGSSDYDNLHGINVLAGWNSGVTDCGDGAPVDLSSAAAFLSENTTPEKKAFAQEYNPNFTYPGQVYDDWVKKGIAETRLGAPIAMLNMEVCSDETQHTEANALQYMKTEIPKIVMAENDEAFEAAKADAIAALVAMGLDKANEEVMSTYEETKAQYASME